MGPITTNTILLDGLRDFGNRTLWRDFDARYRRVIFGFSRRCGLSEEEAGEVAQVTLTEFARGYRAGQYDRSRGRLSAWILSIARHRVIDLKRARGRRREQRGESAFGELAAAPEMDSIWEQEREQALFDLAVAQLRSESRTSDRSWRVFDRLVMAGAKAADVAGELELTVDQVYRIKHRIIQRLRLIITTLRRDYAEE